MLKWWIAIMMVMAALLLWQQPWRQDAVAATKVTAAMVDSLTAVATPAGMVNVHVGYDAFCVDFNPTAHRPNCTAYVLTRERLNGTVARHDQFTTDDRVTGCPPPNAYRGSGLARGHMVPAADMAWNETAMAQTFFMTNVCPQSSALNSGGWSKLEEKVREWAARDSVLVVLAGPVPSATDSVLPSSNVVVPGRFFKVVIAPTARPRMRAIGFIYDNGPCNRPLRHYAVSVDRVEELTGLDFFKVLPPQVEATVERACNLPAWCF